MISGEIKRDTENINVNVKMEGIANDIIQELSCLNATIIRDISSKALEEMGEENKEKIIDKIFRKVFLITKNNIVKLEKGEN